MAQIHLNPYLNFDGKAEEAMNFYKSVFGGDFRGGIMRMRDQPNIADLPENEKDRIMHIALPLPGGNLLMASDILPSCGHRLHVGNNNYISIFVDSTHEADRLFEGLSSGGKVEVAMSLQFWGDYFGSFQDKFGVCWMINFSERGI